MGKTCVTCQSAPRSPGSVRCLHCRAKATGAPMCRCCRVRLVNRPRGLCCPCYSREDVRASFAPKSCKQNSRGVGHASPLSTAAEATAAPPGSPEKVAVLMKRAHSGQGLWHDDDADFYDCPEPRPALERVPAADDGDEWDTWGV